MYKNFIAALNKKYNCKHPSELSGIDLQHYTFAASTNSRGLDAIGVFEAYGFSMDGLRVLDVGCAYGGFAIEAAKKGACCYGVEISDELYEFAMLNHKNEAFSKGSCDFIKADATSTDFLEKLPHDYFDLIIVNDVFEHVYDTVLLLSNLDKAANDRGAIYFVIPNGNDFRFIAREGHTGCCGISLLEPLLWETLVSVKENPERSIYYRQYEYYQALFSQFGFGFITLINYPGYMDGAIAGKEWINTEYKSLKQTIAENEKDFPSFYGKKLYGAFETFSRRLRYDMERLNTSKLAWKYMTKFWGGFAQRKSLDLDSPVKTCERTSRSEHDAYGISFTLSLKGNNIVIDITDTVVKEEFDFAFHLMQRGESIYKSHYQREPHYEWELKSPGMYQAVIFVKKTDHEHKDYRIITQPLYFRG